MVSRETDGGWCLEDGLVRRLGREATAGGGRRNVAWAGSGEGSVSMGAARWVSEGLRGRDNGEQDARGSAASRREDREGAGGALETGEGRWGVSEGLGGGYPVF